MVDGRSKGGAVMRVPQTSHGRRLGEREQWVDLHRKLFMVGGWDREGSWALPQTSRGRSGRRVRG